MSVDQICFDFLIGRLKNNLESEGVKKKNFIDWLYAATIDKAVETEKFELLNKPEIFNSFTADERLKTLFYIATYTDIKFPSPIDIPDALERIANKLLRYIPRGQVDFVTDKLKEYPNQISLNDK